MKGGMQIKATRRKFICGSAVLAGAAAAGGLAAYLNGAQFGRKPSQKRLERIMSSPNWRHGRFHNIEPLVAPRPEYRENRLKIWWKFLFADKSELAPSMPLPSEKTGLKTLDTSRDLAIWLGHSSLFVQLDGKRILVDPVFSDYASPVSFINRAFPGSNIYCAEDFPEIDLLAITHDHWDHLDYPTVSRFLPKIRHAVCPLGVGEYLEQWGMDAGCISEGDWFDSFEIAGLNVTVTPTRHFSGRLRRMNQTLWGGFAIASRARRIFISGDGGWGSHFREIARRLAPFDMAFLENGQYNVKWPNVHLHPHETADVADVIRTRFTVPVHNCKFSLSNHTWSEPMERLATLSGDRKWTLLTPMIGELLDISAPPRTRCWWRDCTG